MERFWVRRVSGARVTGAGAKGHYRRRWPFPQTEGSGPPIQGVYRSSGECSSRRRASFLELPTARSHALDGSSGSTQ